MSNSPAPTFIPTTEELNQLERELRFHPSTVENLRTLTALQVAAFNRDGYLKGIRIFSEQEMAGIRGYFDELLARTLAAGGDSYSISTAHLRHGRPGSSGTGSPFPLRADRWNRCWINVLQTKYRLPLTKRAASSACPEKADRKSV